MRGLDRRLGYVVVRGAQHIFVWYPKFSPKNLSYETRDCYYQKMRQKSRYKMVLCILFVSALPQLVDSVFKMVIGLVSTIYIDDFV